MLGLLAKLTLMQHKYDLAWHAALRRAWHRSGARHERKCAAATEKRSVQCASELGQSVRPSAAASEHVQEDAAVVLCTHSCTGATAPECQSGKIDLRSNETARVSSGSGSTSLIPSQEHCRHAGRRVNMKRERSRAAVCRCTCCTSSASCKVRL